MRLHPGLGVGFAIALALALPGACNSANSAGGDDGGASDATTEEGGDDDAEPLICTEFTEAGAPCAAPSPVRCFAECEAGGCSCTETAEGPRWTCESDLSCLADCAPLDDGCSTPIGDDSGDDGAGDDGAGPADGGDGGGDAGPSDAGDASGSGDARPGDAGDASG